MTRKSALGLMVVTLTLFSTQACTPVSAVMGAGAGAGIAAYQERGIDGVARDLKTATHILDLFARSDHKLLKDISVEVYEGRVLLTGQTKKPVIRAEAVRLAWAAEGTKDVLNEIHVTLEGGILDTARDAWITTQLQAKLTFDKKVYALNYAIETVGGTVYLIGVAQNQQELDRVKNQARSISYVQHIVSHVRIKKQTPTTAGGGQ